MKSITQLVFKEATCGALDEKCPPEAPIFEGLLPGGTA